METLSLDSPRDFHHGRNKESPRHFHKHLPTVTGNGGHVYGQGHMYGHVRKHGHGHGHGHGGRHVRRQNGEGEDLVSGGKQGEGEGKGGRRGRDKCHGCDKRHGGRHGRWGSERSAVLQVPEETVGGKEVLPADKKAADEKDDSSTAVKAAEDATEPASAVETGGRHGCHKRDRCHGGHGHGGGRHGRHGFHGGKDKSFSERDGCHEKHKFGKEHKRDKSHRRDRRSAPLDVVLSTDAYTVRMDAPGVVIDDVSVTREDIVLVIRTERKSPQEDETEGERVLVRERIFGIRVRQVALPKDAVLEAATCEITEGVLTVTVPRRPQDAEGGNRTEEGIRNVEPRGESGVDFEMADEGGAGKAV